MLTVAGSELGVVRPVETHEHDGVGTGRFAAALVDAEDEIAVGA
jgi:hypothetical protein